MKRKKNSILFKTMMLAAMAFMMMNSYRVSAAETFIYKCSNPKGQISFQDFACADDQINELLKIEINQSADTDVGLRDLEKIALERTFTLMILAKCG